MADQKQSKEAQRLIQQKIELVNKVRELRVEIGKVNAELAEAGADAALIACW